MASSAAKSSSLFFETEALLVLLGEAPDPRFSAKEGDSLRAWGVPKGHIKRMNPSLHQQRKQTLRHFIESESAE